MRPARGARGETWFLTNGSTQGNLIACIVASTLGPDVLVQHNMHSSVLAGVILANLRPAFVLPNIDEHLGVAHVVSAESVAALLDRSAGRPAMAFIVSPTYFGAGADVAAIAAVCHARDVPLVVDEAWAGHFGAHPSLPPSALQCGADLVVSSTHKLVGSLTQSAMLHLGDGPFAARLEPLVERAMTLVESTSASSILVASLDGARRWRAVDGPRELPASLAAAQDLRENRSARRLQRRRPPLHRAPDVAFHDPLRVVIDVSRTGQSGTALRSFLHDAQCIDFEVFTHAAIVAVVGPRRGVHPEVERLIEALRQIPAAANRTTQPVATVSTPASRALRRARR